ncbi:MAG: alpha-hydroxy-acid oxidizing protein [Acetobacteraceae bacterium]|nr:alpha-hydroxy-acid oxidizing protein [Acetobacteraceae bacterium]
MSQLSRTFSIEDLRRQARRRLPRLVFDFIDGGAGDESTLRENSRAFENWVLIPRVGVDVSERDLSVNILGRPSTLPLILAPTGLAGFFWPNGEVHALRAASEAGIPFCLSTNSIASMEGVAAALPDSERWFQLYMLKDKGMLDSMLDRAHAAGYCVLCLTIDLPIQGRRERDLRNGFTLPLRPRVKSVWDVARRPQWLYGLARNPVSFGNFGGLGGGATSIAQHVATLFDPAATWDDFARVRERWKGQFVIKGVLHPDDARRAAALGAAAVIVSNHGGRQLDAVPAACAALPGVVNAIGGQAQIILDGGVRRGTDILKALALGASACMIGRPFLWGLASAGPAGVARTLKIFRDELDNGLALLGVRSLKDISGDYIRWKDTLGSEVEGGPRA